MAFNAPFTVNEVLSESKARYPPIQKLLYAILIKSRKLRHYFDEFKISVITNFPLGDTFCTIETQLVASPNGQSS